MIPIIPIAFVFALSALSCGGRTPDGPNLLVVTIDTLRQDALGAFGDVHANTPHLDRLAREGTILTHAQTAVPTTLPSHATMFTGLYPAAHGVRHNGYPLSADVGTLAEMLQDEGYETAAFLASMVLHRSYALDRGYEFYDDGWGESGDATMGLHGQLERRATAVTDAFVTWFGAREAPGRPWHAWVHYYDPHAPYDPAPPFDSFENGYAAQVAECDRAFGRIRAALEDAGQWENTVVVVLSDHGEGLGAHGETEHGLLVFETTIAIPWIVRLPMPGGATGAGQNGGGARSGDGRSEHPGARVVPYPVETVDLLPSVAAWLGLEADDRWQGRSLVPLLDGAPGDEERALYAESYYGAYGYDWEPLHALRVGDWKLVSGAYDELFALTDHPQETRDRATSDPAERTRLARRLEAVRRAWPEAPSPGAGSGDAPALDDEQRAALEALGYVTPKARGTRENHPDPRDVYPVHDLILEGRERYFAGDIDRAERLFLDAIALDSANVDVWIRLADCYRARGESAREESVYVRILAIDPNHAPSWSNLGILIERNGDLAGAYECYENAVAADSNFFHAYANRANLRIERKDLAGAESDYRTALERNAGFADAHLGLARVAHARGDWAEVVRELRTTIRLNPNEARAVDWLKRIEEAHARGEIEITDG